MHYATQTAQFAVREGRQLADNIVAKADGQGAQAVRLHVKRLARLARHEQGGGRGLWHQAVGHARLALVARLLLSFLPGFATKVRVLVNWILNAFVPPNIVLVQSSMPGTRYIHYRKGDEVFEPGMLIDGFYTVTEGSLKLTIDNPEAGEHFESVFGPGEHFGERVLGEIVAAHRARGGAQEAGLLLFIAGKDFTRFARAFPFLDDVFKDYIEKTFGGPTWSLPAAAPSAATSSNRRISRQLPKSSSCPGLSRPSTS